tara:strand:+ start:2380 stop:2862 length:483 start_codon:yes stop_codon:yes gene_type:complete
MTAKYKGSKLDSGALVQAGGINALAKSVRLIRDKELTKEMKKVTKEAAEVIVPYAKRRVPVGTGKLRDSIKAEGTRRYARIKAGTPSRVPYARSVHTGRYFKSNGTRTDGTPYIREAIPEAFPEIIEAFVKGMSRIATEFNKKHGVDRVVGSYKKGTGRK